jgi:hypothetical protein
VAGFARGEKRGLVVAEGEQANRRVKKRRRIVGQRLLLFGEGARRLRAPPCALEDEAELELHASVGRLERKRRAERPDRLLEPFLAQRRCAIRAKGFRT